MQETVGQLFHCHKKNNLHKAFKHFLAFMTNQKKNPTTKILSTTGRKML